jgi:hypothetical protein
VNHHDVVASIQIFEPSLGIIAIFDCRWARELVLELLDGLTVIRIVEDQDNAQNHSVCDHDRLTKEICSRASRQLLIRDKRLKRPTRAWHELHLAAKFHNITIPGCVALMRIKRPPWPIERLRSDRSARWTNGVLRVVTVGRARLVGNPYAGVK